MDGFSSLSNAEKVFGRIINTAFIRTIEDGSEEIGESSETTSLIKKGMSEKKIRDWWTSINGKFDKDCAELVYKALEVAGADLLGISDRAFGRIFHTPDNACLYADELAKKVGIINHDQDNHYKKMCRKIDGYNEFISTSMYQ
jgi:hypothetical protein